ncbi:putative Aspartic proteinase-like protein 2 [Cocos nucifera]|nr:putative Aspartic proteinase-like protein 2 [Cocos nucifera]
MNGRTYPISNGRPHYNVNLKAIEVGGAFLQLPTDLFENGDKKGTIIDSGTTLSYLPEAAYKPLMNAIFSYQPNLSFHAIQDFLCFQYTGSVDDGFPNINFHFENSLSLNVYPHDYLFQNEIPVVSCVLLTGSELNDDVYCVGWQNGGMQSKDGKDMFLLGAQQISMVKLQCWSFRECRSVDE